jgi:hypothetical protein
MAVAHILGPLSVTRSTKLGTIPERPWAAVCTARCVRASVTYLCYCLLNLNQRKVTTGFGSENDARGSEIQIAQIIILLSGLHTQVIIQAFTEMSHCGLYAVPPA